MDYQTNPPPSSDQPHYNWLDLLSISSDTDLSTLYPDIPDNYFADDQLMPVSRKNKCPENILPFIQIKNLNGKSDREFDDTKSHLAVEVGLRLDF